jgi:hypothetical protein
VGGGIRVTCRDGGTGFRRLRSWRSDRSHRGSNKTYWGKVLRTLQQSVRISDGWRTSHEQTLAARNRFVHGSLIESVERMADPATRPSTLADIKRVRSTVLEGDRTVRQMLQTIFAYGGSDFGTLMAEVAAEVRRLNTAGEAGHA